MKPPAILYDNVTLRDYPENPAELAAYIEWLNASLAETTPPEKRMSVLGTLGVFLRVAGRLSEAETALNEALHLVQANKLGVSREIQQKLRLAHVLQWKKDFVESTKLFSECLEDCEKNQELDGYLAFAYQHAGKNYFDQALYVEAKNCFEKALNLRLKTGAPPDQIESSMQSLAVAMSRL